jgi:hypothetical protein
MALEMQLVCSGVAVPEVREKKVEKVIKKKVPSWKLSSVASIWAQELGTFVQTNVMCSYSDLIIFVNLDLPSHLPLNVLTQFIRR